MISVENASPHDQQAGLGFYYHTYAAEERTALIAEFNQADTQGDISLENLLIAKLQGAIVGVLLFHRQPDGSAFLWPPVVRHESLCDDIAKALIESACEQLAASGTAYIQVLVEPEDTEASSTLLRNGFEILSQLAYLQRSLKQPLPDRSEMLLQTVSYTPQLNDDQFAHVLEQTYLGTLDCPKFTAVRDGKQALYGHRFSGTFSPQQWKLYSLEGQNAGLLLMNDHDDQSAWEVVYMGVVPEFRGRGIGRSMLISGLYDVVDSGRDSVLLAVDCDNRFALQIYQDIGFMELAERNVLIRNL